MNLFSVSSIQHLFFAQCLAKRERDHGQRNVLLIWTHLNDDRLFPSIRSIIARQLWDEVIEIPPGISSLYRTRQTGRLLCHFVPIRTTREGMSARQHITRVLESRKSVLEKVFITNPEYSIDRLIGFWCNDHAIPLEYLEDGLKPYLNQEFSSTQKPDLLRRVVRTSRTAFFKMMGHSDLDSRALSTGVGTLDSSLRFETYNLMFPEAIQDVVPGNKVRDLRKIVTPTVLRELEAGYPRKLDLGTLRTPVLFISRADSEDGLIPRNMEIQLVSELLRELGKRSGKPVYFKKHPRDEKSKIQSILDSVPGLQIIDTEISWPVELAASAMGIEFCAGVWTAPMVYLPAMYGIQTFTFMPWMVNNLHKAGVSCAKYESICSRLRSLFPDATKWVENLDSIPTSHT